MLSANPGTSSSLIMSILTSPLPKIQLTCFSPSASDKEHVENTATLAPHVKQFDHIDFVVSINSASICAPF
ncbi:hypothetical protein TL16_g08967 [Triparma laevis f. inornata]|uniref:Uncharacterized protein n=1 Tax=Triparma laevis f. inornata TaxID=1714386 RepID=A0A9W7EHT4_9STRA|nr:hypothetical protein TL16_g08967 [Triparma laevis f. inornata]